jgi:hypothetical protein
MTHAFQNERKTLSAIALSIQVFWDVIPGRVVSKEPNALELVSLRLVLLDTELSEIMSVHKGGNMRNFTLRSIAEYFNADITFCLSV